MGGIKDELTKAQQQAKIVSRLDFFQRIKVARAWRTWVSSTMVDADSDSFAVDDNMLHQLQKLMANLELSERPDFNPWEFCFAFKEFDGSPTNTAEQKDAQEFLNLVFDRLENALKHTPKKYLLQSVFGG